MQRLNINHNNMIKDLQIIIQSPHQYNTIIIHNEL